jgi:hypothetical protein
MPTSTVDLTDEKLRDAAQAARLAAAQAQRDADAQPNPSIKQAFSADVVCYTALGEKFEWARQRPRQGVSAQYAAIPAERKSK